MNNKELYDRTELMLTAIDSLIESGHPSTGTLKLAREHVQYACAYIAHDRLGEAGDHLTTARCYLRSIKGGWIIAGSQPTGVI